MLAKMQSNWISYENVNGIATVQYALAGFFLNIYLPYDSTVSLLDSYPREIKTYVLTETCVNVNGRSVHNSPKLETTQMSFNR